MSDRDLDRFEEFARELEDRDDVETSTQSIGTLRETIDSEDLRELPPDEILETSGLLSTVLEDGDEIGHVLMVEYDDIDDVMRPIRQAERTPGISVLLRSSPGSYHVYNLSVRDRDTQLLDAVRKDGDVWQARWAVRRGHFVLRILAKRRSESREIYKDAPEPVRVFSSESEFPQSSPHLEILEDLCRRQAIDDVL